MRFSAAANHSSLEETIFEPRGAEMRSGGASVRASGRYEAEACDMVVERGECTSVVRLESRVDLVGGDELGWCGCHDGLVCE